MSLEAERAETEAELAELQARLKAQVNAVPEADIPYPDVDEPPGTEHDVRGKLASQQQEGWTPEMGYTISVADGKPSPQRVMYVER